MEKIYESFCDQVCAAIPRATAREREVIRQELLDHLEDHALDMMERSWTAEEAAERSVAAMGDPAEIGKAWNDQLSPFWLWVVRLAMLANSWLLLVLLLALSIQGSNINHNLEARRGDLDNYRHGMDDAVKKWELDERIDMGDYALRFYQAGIIPSAADGYELEVRAAIYAQNPLHETTMNVMNGVEAPPGEAGWKGTGGTGLGGAVWYYSYSYPLGEERPESVTMATENHHGSFQVDFAIDWSDVP